MFELSLLTWFFGVQQLAVIIGYMLFSLYVVPRIPHLRFPLILSSSLFFASCSMTHFEQFWHYRDHLKNFRGSLQTFFMQPVVSMGDVISFHMQMNMTVQAIATVAAVTIVIYNLDAIKDDVEMPSNLIHVKYNRYVIGSLIISALYILMFLGVGYYEEQYGSLILPLLLR